MNTKYFNIIGNAIIYFAAVNISLFAKGEIQEKTTISPLIQTTWGQGSPFNLKMIEYINSSVTGCTPTALCQIMKYYNYPSHGIKDNSYTYEGNIINYNLQENFFDWDNMLDNYIDGEYTTTQANAVSELMFATSTTLPMSHTAHPFGNGPLPFCEVASLQYFFDYDTGMRTLEHKYIDEETWENIIYHELSKGRPVYCAGYGNGFGHSYLCDGYENGRYHFNWGWDGSMNDYFSLETLQNESFYPSNMGYIYDQKIVIGITPKNVNNEPNPFVQSNHTIVIDSDFGKSFRYRIMRLTPYTCEIGLKISNNIGTIAYIKTNDLTINSRHQQGITLNLPTTIDNLTDGDYIVTPIHRESASSTWEDIPVPLDKIHYMNLKITNKKCSFTNGTEAKCFSDIHISDFSPNEMYPNEFNTFNITTINNGTFPYYQGGRLDIFDVSGKLIESKYIQLCAHHLLESQTLSYSISVDLPVGNYKVQFFDQNTEESISEKFDLVIKNKTDSSVETTYTDSKTSKYYNLNGTLINPNNLTSGIYIKWTGTKYEKILIK